MSSFQGIAFPQLLFNVGLSAVTVALSAQNDCVDFEDNFNNQGTLCCILRICQWKINSSN